jgi:tryptophanyl-tRNA synthetase
MDKRESIVSGMRATGRLHIGNYLGALKQWVDLQNTADKQCYFFMADLHALTTPFDPKTLRQDTLDAVAEYIAAGIDPKKSVLFIQNHIPEHAELTWIFNCITPISELERMTQFKDKSKQTKENINIGLLDYPVLMATDILLYKPTLVPVGDDQTQHLELTRLIARKFNNKFGQTFPEPKNFLMKPLRIMSLTHPDQKMSKTNDEALMLDDTPEEISRKLKKAVTATEGDSKSPGAENLLFLLRHFGTKDQITRFEDASKDGSIKFSELKQVLAQDIIEHFAEFREKKRALLNDTDVLSDILADGARRAKAVAHETLMEVKEKVGLL